jgi:hypothetical protein
MSIRYGIKILMLIIFPLSLHAQEEVDITGLWKGFMYNDTTQQNLRYEIAVSKEGGKYYAYSHQYFIVGDREYHGVKKLKIKREGDEVNMQEYDLVVHNYPTPPAKGVWQQNKLVLTIQGSTLQLTGPFKTNITRNYHQLTGYVHVERNYDYAQSALVPHLKELNLVKNLTFLEEAIASTDNFVLKPVATDDEIKNIVAAAQKKDVDYTVASSTAPTVVTPKPIAPVQPDLKKETVAVVKETNTEVVSTEPTRKKITPEKKEVTQTVVAKEKPKVVEPAIVKTAPVKPQPAAPTAIKKSEPAIAAKPEPVAKATAKQQQPTITTTTTPVEPAIVKTTPIPVTPKPVATPVIDPTAATDVAKRKVETIKALYFKSDSLTLTLYDNGEVDGDTVSVLMNGQLIMPKIGLTTNAVRKTIYTNQIEGDSIQLVMYAESLGSLPPNTGLLIVNDGTDRYEIRFSGDMQKSSAIVFRRRRE